MSTVEGAVSIDPVALLQGRLGIDEAQARDLANIAVACPDPRGQGAELSLGDFMTSEHGQSTGKADQIIDTAVEEHREGATPEKAIARALGMAATKDKETGRLVRIEPVDVKKKPK